MNKHVTTENLFIIPNENEEELMWKNISSQIKKQQRFNAMKKYSVAAIFLILFAVGSLTGYNKFISPDIYIAQSKDLKINLQDGSIITLLKGGKLTVEKSFPQKTRDVFLSGNAIFSISKSKEHPFIVHTENYNTKVLGTVFKIVQNNKEFKVELYEGKVAVQKKNTTETIYLAPNNTFDNFGNTAISTVSKTQDNIQLVTAKNKTINSTSNTINLSFDECKVADAVKVIEKSYEINIIYPEDFKDRNISLAIENASKETILQTLATYLNLKLKKHETSYQFEK